MSRISGRIKMRFDYFFRGPNSGFFHRGFENENSFYKKHRLSYNVYMNSVLEKTYTKPYIIFVYSGYSQVAHRLENTWKSAVEDLEPLGYGIGTVNSIWDGNLLDTLRYHSNLGLMVVVEGRVLYYRGNMATINSRDIRRFARDAIPKTFLSHVDSNDGLMRVVDSWKHTNKISVVIMGPKPEPRVRYLLAAMKYSHFARFAYVHSKDPQGAMREMKDALGVKCTMCDNMFVFNDYPEEGPVDRISKPTGNDTFSTEEIDSFMKRNTFVSLPRLSSYEHFEHLCPVSSRSSKQLCFILPVTDAAEEAIYIAEVRKYVKKEGDRLKKDKVRFAFVYVNRQQKFMEPFLLKLPENHAVEKRDLLVVWRLEHTTVQFGWLKSVVNADENKFYVTVTDVNKAVENVLQGNIQLNHRAKIVKLVNEYAPSFFTRLSHRAVRFFETVSFNLNKSEFLPMLSVIGTMIAIFTLPFLVQYLNRPRMRPRPSNVNADGTEWHPDDPTNEKALTKSELKLKAMGKLIRELRAETYYGLIRLLKPGCRTFVILVDSETRETLLPMFASQVWALRNNKTFSFAYLMVDKNLPWFRKLLENILPADTTENGNENDASQQMYKRLQKINPKQTLGTVLVICGWKLYFSMYHPMHNASARKPATNYGFDSEDSESDVSSNDDDLENAALRKATKSRKLVLRDVLNGFPNWLDRMLEGSIRRYHVPEWPDNLK
ncbi:hypothetical protein L596_001139 [Steinernema carpocapsae]|uniref:Uncharacterized protein n=1 Tax=Steinernema carpocapsae TaxID=34508 RepID=A0A4U8UMH0_STECR|nr:hypothetical protein L596_001139 [Steinernema carpocapsae]